MHEGKSREISAGASCPCSWRLSACISLERDNLEDHGRQRHNRHLCSSREVLADPSSLPEVPWLRVYGRFSRGTEGQQCSGESSRTPLYLRVPHRVLVHTTLLYQGTCFVVKATLMRSRCRRWIPISKEEHSARECGAQSLSRPAEVLPVDLAFAQRNKVSMFVPAFSNFRIFDFTLIKSAAPQHSYASVLDRAPTEAAAVAPAPADTRVYTAVITCDRTCCKWSACTTIRSRGSFEEEALRRIRRGGGAGA